MYKTTLSGQVWRFDSLKTLMAKASPARSGDALAGIIATSAEERMAAKMALAEVPLTDILDNPLIPYEQDEVTRLILDTHDAQGFAALRHLTVGDFRDWLLDYATDTATLQRVARAITPEMAAAVSKLMRNQDLILAASKCQVVTRFRNTIGLPGHLSVRLQPNHPTDDLKGIAASMLDGLLYGAGDAVIGINPASDSLPVLAQLNTMLDDIIQRFAIPTQSCRWAERGEAMMRRRRHPPRVESGAGQSLARDGVMRHGMPREMFLSASWHRPLRSDNCPLWLIHPEVVYF